MIIEVTLDGRGAVRIEADCEPTQTQIKRLVTHATTTLTSATGTKSNPIGFGAGSSTHLGQGNGSEADPTEAGWVVR